MLPPQQLVLYSCRVRFDFVSRICASMPIGVRHMDRIDEANETHAVTGSRRLVIQIASGKQVVCKKVLWGCKYTKTPCFHFVPLKGNSIR